MKLVQPQLEELKYRKKLLKDKKTMAFNKVMVVLLILMKKFGNLGMLYG